MVQLHSRLYYNNFLYHVSNCMVNVTRALHPVYLMQQVNSLLSRSSKWTQKSREWFNSRRYHWIAEYMDYRRRSLGDTGHCIGTHRWKRVGTLWTWKREDCENQKVLDMLAGECPLSPTAPLQREQLSPLYLMAWVLTLGAPVCSVDNSWKKYIIICSNSVFPECFSYGLFLRNQWLGNTLDEVWFFLSYRWPLHFHILC